MRRNLAGVLIGIGQPMLGGHCRLIVNFCGAAEKSEHRRRKLYSRRPRCRAQSARPRRGPWPLIEVRGSHAYLYFGCQPAAPSGMRSKKCQRLQKSSPGENDASDTRTIPPFWRRNRRRPASSRRSDGSPCPRRTWCLRATRPMLALRELPLLLWCIGRGDDERGAVAQVRIGAVEAVRPQRATNGANSKWKVPLPGGQARRNKLLVSWGPLVIAAPLAGSLLAPLRCAAPCHFRCRAVSPPSRSQCPSQAAFAPFRSVAVSIFGRRYSMRRS